MLHVSVPTLASVDEQIMAIAVGGGLLLAFVGMLMGFIKSLVRVRAREQTKREIAAYIAEGTMTPEDGERLIKADIPQWERGRDA
jgi:hypothetical protein